MTNQSLFTWFEEKRFDRNHAFMANVISDRGSKYSVSWGIVTGDKSSIKHRISQYLSDKYFLKATHNTYAYRIRDSDGLLSEGKNDDGETWAGQCILNVLQRENIVDGIIVVTRYFWWVQLHGDRFRHVIDATKMFVEEYAKY
jgi:putative IMPACT (imprinted ancient) family translation regulator